jgi:hypothetical protein
MSEALTPADAKSYLARWAEVGEREAELARRESVTLRFRQLCAMFDARHLFPADPDRDRESDAVRSRWQQLRETGSRE